MYEPIVRVDKLAKAYGFHQIFTNVSFLLKAGEKVALVGPNGVGKSTLLKILAGVKTADTGTVTLLQEQVLCQYVPQMPRFGLSTARNILNEETHRLGVLARATSAEAISRFGFSEGDADLVTPSLSGGQKTRLALAKAWLSQPDLLLLDEPTNHLDIAALEWLEKFVLDYPGSVLVASHDRVFLDSVATRVIELSQDGVTEYPGNYSSYRQAKAQAFAQQMAQYESEQKRIRQLEAAIDGQMRHFEQSHRIAGQHDFYRRKAKKLAKTGKASIKRLEMMKASSVAKPRSEQSITLQGFQSMDSGRRLVLAENLGKSYDKVLFRQGSFSILRGDKVALVGPNGTGKTTLLRMILGREEPSEGQLWVSPSASIGYLDQEMEQLDTENRVMEEMLMVLPRQTREEVTKLRTFLANLLFDSDDLGKPVSVLSVGEKKRVAMAKLLLSSHNLLLLDEPTNHLDLPSRETLEESLVAYEGTLVLVSHDRYLLRRISNKVITIDDECVVTYPGGFAEYEARLAKQKARKEEKVVRSLSPEERLLLETRLAQLGSELGTIPKDDPAYPELEKDFLATAKKLRS